MRNPIVGLVPPRKRRTVIIAPAMKESERVVAVGPSQDFHLSYPDANTVIVENHSDRFISFALMVVDKRVAALGRVPWARVLGELQSPGGPQRILSAFLGAAQQHLLGEKPDPPE